MGKTALRQKELKPRPELLEAFREGEEILRKLQAGEYVKTYSCTKEMFADILAEDDDDDDL